MIRIFPQHREPVTALRPRLGAAALLLLAACGGSTDAATLRAAPVVDAGGVVLTGARLVHFLESQPQRSTRESSAFVVSTWIDYALVAKAIADHRAFTDSALVDAVIWPDAARAALDDFRRQMALKRPPFPDELLDSVYNNGEARALQHILVRLAPNAPKPVVDSAVVKLRRIAERVGASERARREKQKGETFADIARATSEDLNAKDGGYFPAAPRGALPPAFEELGWKMAPGEIRGILRTPVGLHLVRRPPLDEVRPQIRAWAVARSNQRADSLFADSLSRTLGSKPAADAAARTRRVLTDPYEVDPNAAPLVTWQGGELTEEQLRRWLSAVNARELITLRAQGDAPLERFLHALGESEMGLRASPAKGNAITPQARKALVTQYTASIPVLTETVGKQGADPAAQADAMMQHFIDGTLQYRPLPGALGFALRRLYPVKIDSVKVAEVLAQVQQVQDDSARARRRRRAEAGITDSAADRPDSTRPTPVPEVGKVPAVPVPGAPHR